MPRLQILLEFFAPILAVRPHCIHPRDEFCGKGDTGYEAPVRVARALDQPPSAGVKPFRQGLMQTHEPLVLHLPGRQGYGHIDDGNPPATGRQSDSGIR